MKAKMLPRKHSMQAIATAPTRRFGPGRFMPTAVMAKPQMLSNASQRKK
jgi:hypothetical protein